MTCKPLSVITGVLQNRFNSISKKQLCRTFLFCSQIQIVFTLQMAVSWPNQHVRGMSISSLNLLNYSVKDTVTDKYASAMFWGVFWHPRTMQNHVVLN